MKTWIVVIALALLAGCATKPQPPKRPPLPPPPPPPGPIMQMQRQTVAQVHGAKPMPPQAAPQQPRSKPDFDPELLLLKHRAGARPAEIDNFHRQHGGKRFKRVGWSFVKVDKPEKRRAYEQSRLFDVVRPSYLYHTCDLVPNDTLWTNQWGPLKIQAPKAWDVKTSNDVVVAVIDTGIDFNHPDLRDNLWTGPQGEHGYSIFGGSVFEGGQDDHYHGSHVAGTIGAMGNNLLGVAGLNWRCKLLALKFLTAGGSGNEVDAVLAVEKMVELKEQGHNIRVSNNSWGRLGAEHGPLTEAFFLAEQAGILNICAAGNNGIDTDDTPFTPAGLAVEGIVSVLASDINDNKAGFSNYGLLTTDILAPGDNILSCFLGGGYRYASGTSMASPHVAGVAAMLFAMRPDMDTLTARSILLDKDSLDQVAFRENSTFGGRLNMFKAITNPRLSGLPGNTNEPPVLTLNVQTNLIVLQPGEQVTVSASASDPNGDTLQFQSRAKGKQSDYALLRTFSEHLLVANGLPSVTLTNLPRAQDMAVNQLFFVSDGHGGSDSKSVTILMRRDASKVRDIKPMVGPVTVQSNTPYYTVNLPATIPINYAYHHGQQCCGTFWCCNYSIIAQWPGLNIVHPWAVDEWGNFADVTPVHFQLGGTNPPPPFATVIVDKLSGEAPLTITAQIKVHDPEVAARALYMRKPWQAAFSDDFDWYNPIKTFTLTTLGINPIEFEVYDDFSRTWDKTVFLFTVLPPGLTNTTPLHLSILTGPLRVRITSEPKAVVRLEGSADLRTWSTVATVTNTSGTVEVPITNSGAQRLFRARR